MVTADRLGRTATLITPCVTVIVAGPLFVLSATAVAVKVTVAGFGTFAGPLYVTDVVVMFVSEPQVLPLQPEPERDQVTP